MRALAEHDPLVLDIIRFALHDGPGIRTTVFLKGCPLRCQFCHNPESQELAQEVGNDSTVYGEDRALEEIMAIVRKDKAYYRNSGGGLTISGGDPLMFPEYTRDLLRLAKAEGIHTAVDTSGFASESALAEVLPFTDLFLFDYKATGEAEHRALTGVGQSRILENLAFLAKEEKPVILRCVLIEGVNDTSEHLAAIAEIAAKYPNIAKVDILPFHNTGNHKYTRLGRDVPLPLDNATDEAKARWTRRLLDLGVQNLTVGGTAVNSEETQ